MKKVLVSKEEELKDLLDFTRLPQHIAIIMDGNRRWAKERQIAVALGHKAGVTTLRNIIQVAAEIGIKILTVYAFSKENWHRSKEEISTLLFLFEYYIQKERESLYENGIRFQVLGNLKGMPAKLQKEFKKTIDLTADNQKLIFNLAFNYGARAEWVEVVKTIAEKVKNNQITLEEITDAAIEKHLYTNGLPDPDLLIRTSGEQRISNFLLWQLAYTELWFTNTFWPDFTTADFLSAIIEYQKRQRRFGGN